MAKDYPYGIKAYGRWQTFSDEREFRKYLMEWIHNTEGSERDRAVYALDNLENGILKTDTDK